MLLHEDHRLTHSSSFGRLQVVVGFLVCIGYRLNDTSMGFSGQFVGVKK